MATKQLNHTHSDIERFWKQIIPEPNSGCWLWTGTVNNKGYGIIRSDKKRYLVHRFSYLKHVGEIPNDRELDHKCRVRCCVNPDHLEVVTHAENMKRGTAAKKAGEFQRAKTHCPSGHPYSGENLFYGWNGGRVCRECNRKHALKSKRKRMLELV